MDRGGHARGIDLAPEAKRSTLIKRAYYNLTGLPPTADEQRHWLEHTSSAWFDEMLEKLLASPAYGERWARHWLDVGGYADSAAYNGVTSCDPGPGNIATT
ncbi:MAG: DUF1549 domain-containing protein [Pirellulaceae bacterium]